MSDKVELYKLAQDAIIQLRDENTELQTELNKTKEAVKLAFSLYNSGQISAHMVELKIDEFSKMSENDLNIVKQASEMTKVALDLNSSPFKLSNSANYDDYTQSPNERFNSFLMEEL